MNWVVGMAGQSNAAPVIIKRKKVIQGGGHHGGAWKVAYADFVTAMMAFFMLMWLLNATTEKQRKGIADYFNPAIPIVRISGGGSGAFGGDSVFSEQQLAQQGTGAASAVSTDQNKARGEAEAADGDSSGQTAELQEIEKTLLARGGESMTMETMLRHVVTRVTDEGLVIEIFDLDEAPLFAEGSSLPEGVTKDIAAMLAEVLVLTKNQIAISGHVRSYPITLVANPAWDLSADRAQAMRGLIETAGLKGGRMQRISGYSDRISVTPNPTDTRNNRLEVILLRKDR
jgi:chemotaxis protein MotB